MTGFKTTAVSVAKPRLIRPPAALAVITGGGYGYQRPDGVGVIPVGGAGAMTFRYINASQRGICDTDSATPRGHPLRSPTPPSLPPRPP